MSWNGSDIKAGKYTSKLKSQSSHSGNTRPSPFIFRGLIAASIICVAGVLVYLALPSKESVRIEPKEDRPKQIEVVTPELTPLQETAPKIEEPAKPKVDPAKIREVNRLQALSKEEREDIAFQKMKERPLDLTPKTNRIFRTGTEASIARIFMTQVGDPPPPFFTTKIPLRDEAHLAEILIANNPALETDTEAQKAAKEMVELAKKEMIQYIKDGGHPEDFLEYYHGKLQEAHLERTESMKAFMQVAREDPTIAGEFLEKLNQNLSDKGIKTIQLSDSQKRRFGIED